MSTLEALLLENDVTLENRRNGQDRALGREAITKLIGNNFESFDPIRRHLINGTDLPETEDPIRDKLLNELLLAKMIRPKSIHKFEFSASKSRSYLEGIWLEEYVWFAMREANADEAYFGQHIWIQQNQLREIDCIARRGDQLVFVSCKCFRPYLLDRHRERRVIMLQEAIEEIDFFVQYFSKSTLRVGLVVSVDLIDELNGMKPRYPCLQEQANQLNVTLIGGDHLAFSHLTSRLAKLLRHKAS